MWKDVVTIIAIVYLFGAMLAYEIGQARWHRERMTRRPMEGPDLGLLYLLTVLSWLGLLLMYISVRRNGRAF